MGQKNLEHLSLRISQALFYVGDHQIAARPLFIVSLLQVQAAEADGTWQRDARVGQVAYPRLLKLSHKQVILVPVDVPLPVHAVLVVAVSIVYRVASGQLFHEKQSRGQVGLFFHHHHVPAYEHGVWFYLINLSQKRLLPRTKAIVMEV